MRTLRLMRLLLVASALSAAFSAPAHSQLAKTHKLYEPGHWGADFETSLSIHEWSKISRAPGDAVHPVHFALRARNMDKIKEIADAVADPTSPRYGQHLDIDQIANIVQAPESEIAAVTSWLRANNIPHKISATRHIVEAEAPVAAVEALLNCELYVFTNNLEPERSLVRKVGAMYLPHGVANVVSGVFNVADPPLSRKGAIPRKPRPASPSNLPKSAPQTKPIVLPSQPTRPAIGQLVSIVGMVFAPGQVLEPSPTAPVQIFAYLRCYTAVQPDDFMKANNCNTTAYPFVSMSFQLFITDSRNLFAAGSSFNFPQFINLNNIDALCPPEADGDRLCSLSFNVQVPPSMSVQGVAQAVFRNAPSAALASFVIQPALVAATPQLLARLYNAPLQYTCLDKRTSFAIYSASQVVKQDDLNEYGRWMGLTLGEMTFDNLPYANCTECTRNEATLDVEIMLGMVKGATMWHWNFDKDGFFYFMANALLNNLAGTPDVVSVSYGTDESNPNGPRPQVLIVNDLFTMLATTSKTIIAASGDHGVYGNGCNCAQFTDPSQCNQCCSRSFSFPEWPATCPYVTSVGGTSAVVSGSSPFYQNPSGTQNTNQQYHMHEIMAGDESGAQITSGGGYSGLFPALPFMTKAIRGYLKQQSTDISQPESIITQSAMWPAFSDGISNGTLMRGYPDISALAARIPVFSTEDDDGPFRILAAGTSASTPIVAAYVVMMNDMRLQAGLSKLGNILPLIYMLGDKHPEVFNDVTVGYHGFSMPKDQRCPYCMTKLDCVINGQKQGLSAAAGWDAVTGFGSINFERMLRYVLPGSDAVSMAAAAAGNGNAAATAAAVASASADAKREADSSKSIAIAALVVTLLLLIANLFMLWKFKIFQFSSEQKKRQNIVQANLL